jgi:hypothetical protein
LEEKLCRAKICENWSAVLSTDSYNLPTAHGKAFVYGCILCLLKLPPCSLELIACEVSDSKTIQPTADAKLTATAYHEAGHAVIALALGRAISRVTVVPNQRYLGACHLQKSRFKPTKDWLEDEILILFAGMVAESRVTGKLCASGATQDLRGVRRLATMRAGGDRQVERLERRLLDKTEYLVNDSTYWLAIETIAKELMVHQTISGRAARHHFELAEKQSEA